MVKYAEFLEIETGSPVYVNPSAVIIIRPNATAEQGTVIYFDDRQEIAVRESLSEVVSSLES